MSINAKEIDANKQDAKGAVASYISRTLADMKTDLAGTTIAMGRQGASELALALKSFPDAIGPVDAVGTPYNPTQMQVSQEFGVYGNHDASRGKGSIYGTEPQQTPDVSHDKAPEMEP